MILVTPFIHASLAERMNDSENGAATLIIIVTTLVVFFITLDEYYL